MTEKLKVGDLVTRLEGGRRMKVASITAADGQLVCTWTRGPAKFRRSFEPTALMRSVASLALPR
jgi:uncharacterized protein YodC (DUF2158 family)